MGNTYNEKKYTEDEILKCIKNSAGIVSTIAKNLDCSWHTAERYINMYEETRKAYNDECEKVLDLAESKLIEQLNSGDGTMIRYILSTKGKKRGFTEKAEIEHSSNPDKPLTININPVKPIE